MARAPAPAAQAARGGHRARDGAAGACTRTCNDGGGARTRAGARCGRGKNGARCRRGEGGVRRKNVRSAAEASAAREARGEARGEADDRASPRARGQEARLVPDAHCETQTGRPVRSGAGGQGDHARRDRARSGAAGNTCASRGARRQGRACPGTGASGSGDDARGDRARDGAAGRRTRSRARDDDVAEAKAERGVAEAKAGQDDMEKPPKAPPKKAPPSRPAAKPATAPSPAPAAKKKRSWFPTSRAAQHKPVAQPAPRRRRRTWSRANLLRHQRRHPPRRRTPQ